VHALDEDVGGGDHPATGRGDHGGVVAGPEEDCVVAGQPGGDGSDEPELAHVACGSVAHADQPSRKRSDAVVQAYILIQTEVGKAAAVAEAIAKLDGVAQAEDVTGPYDVIVRAEAKSVDELGKLVVARIQGVDGITRTLTCPVVHL